MEGESDYAQKDVEDAAAVVVRQTQAVVHRRRGICAEDAVAAVAAGVDQIWAAAAVDQTWVVVAHYQERRVEDAEAVEVGQAWAVVAHRQERAPLPKVRPVP